MKIKTKYNGIVDLGLYQEHCIKNIFKILPLMEENKRWQKFLEGFLIELSGVDSLLQGTVEFTSIIGKLEGLLVYNETSSDFDKDLFKKIIFDSIDLVKKLGSD